MQKCSVPSDEACGWQTRAVKPLKDIMNYRIFIFHSWYINSVGSYRNAVVSMWCWCSRHHCQSYLLIGIDDASRDQTQWMMISYSSHNAQKRSTALRKKICNKRSTIIQIFFLFVFLTKRLANLLKMILNSAMAKETTRLTPYTNATVVSLYAIQRIYSGNFPYSIN